MHDVSPAVWLFVTGLIIVVQVPDARIKVAIFTVLILLARVGLI